MNMKKLFIFFILINFAIVVSFFTGCSPNKEKEEQIRAKQNSERAQQELRQLHEKLLKDIEQRKGNNQQEVIEYKDQISVEEKERKEKINVVEKCDKAFQKCIDKCETDECEQGCIIDLSNCEKNVPPEFQTLKSY